MTATMLSEEQLLLTHSEAEKLLRSQHVPIRRVVRVDEDVITYLAPSERIMTAWLERDRGRVRVYVQSGLPAEPDGNRVLYGNAKAPEPPVRAADVFADIHDPYGDPDDFDQA